MNDQICHLRGRMGMSFKHETVLLEEAVAGLDIKSDGIYIDCTLGGGGHTALILKYLDEGQVIAFDQDLVAIDHAREKFAEEIASEKLILIHSNFSKITEVIINELGLSRIDGVLYDLGVSSPQFDEGERGFSYRYDAKLDMRMDRTSELTAYDIVNDWPYEDLVKIFFRYGEEKFSKSIARQIERRRSQAKITSTFELVEIIKEAIPARARRTGGHPAKRIFQALRIAVNDELSAFEKSLEQAIALVDIGGRISVITFHSLEDRLCKQIFKEYATQDDLPKDLPILPSEIEEATLKLINRKPIVPAAEELEQNPRSKSAKLRIAEKQSDLK